ncbi:MAG: YceI family protein [Rhizomicrobium sp.]
MVGAFRRAFVGAALAVALGGAVAPPPAPMRIPHGQHTIAAADSGAYTMDPNHMAIIVQVSHLGFSISYFRFGAATAKLDWDAKTPANSRLSAVVDTTSIATPVPGFAEELQGPQYLDARQFPHASFVSTAFRQTDLQHGAVDGKFTLRGVTRPVTFQVTLIGAGPGFAGGPTIGHVIGIHAETRINAADYGLPAILGEQPMVLSIDTEFDKLP